MHAKLRVDITVKVISIFTVPNNNTVVNIVIILERKYRNAFSSIDTSGVFDSNKFWCHKSGLSNNMNMSHIYSFGRLSLLSVFYFEPQAR
jgi:hypothetical protein